MQVVDAVRRDHLAREQDTGMTAVHRPPKVLELGSGMLFAEISPDTTVPVWWNANPALFQGRLMRGWAWTNLWRAFRLARSPDTDLIVWHASPYAPWDLRFIGRMLAKLGPLAVPYLVKYALGFLVIATARRPVVVIDREDGSALPRHGVWLLKRCRCYFKRELPGDHWRLLQGTVHPRLPTPRLRRSKHLRQALDRLRPISLGPGRAIVETLPVAERPKTADVFFAGAVDGNSTVRPAGLHELEALRNEGIRVDIPDRRLDPKEYFDRCAAAWLVWSPEGLGWDCFRHYEAPLCGSVPVINRSPNLCHRPLRDGEHCFIYDLEQGGLTRTIRRALADKDRLRAMAIAGRDHVLAHHTARALCDYVLREAGVEHSRRNGDPESSEPTSARD